MKLTLGFSPCPNDTFIFEALVHNKIDTEGIDFEVRLEDVQTLNQWAIDQTLDITKLSFGVLPLVRANYRVLNAGSALGSGVGPLLIAPGGFDPDVINAATIAIPGKNTTAHLLFSLAYPDVANKVFLRYDEIEDYVLSGRGPGVIIHENRFTYQARGLKKIVDLGEFWEQKTGNPIPLGGIVIHNRFDSLLQKKIDRLIRQSIVYAFKQLPELNDYIRAHAQEMSELVMRQHIDLYVNEYSINLGDAGRAAIMEMMNVYEQMNATAPLQAPGGLFVEE